MNQEACVFYFLEQGVSEGPFTFHPFTSFVACPDRRQWRVGPPSQLGLGGDKKPKILSPCPLVLEKPGEARGPKVGDLKDLENQLPGKETHSGGCPSHPSKPKRAALDLSRQGRRYAARARAETDPAHGAAA